MSEYTQPLRVFVVEEHTEALEVLFLSVRRRWWSLGQKSATFVHFDSHPDLGCSERLRPEHLTDRTELCHILRNSEDGISCFLMPAIAIGLIDSVVWVKPPWSKQIAPGVYDLVLGWDLSAEADPISKSTNFGADDESLHEEESHSANGRLKVAAPTIPYWTEDCCSVSNREQLVDTTTFHLVVREIDTWDIIHNRETSSWILDICLDYFSCSNPLQEPDQPEHISTQEEILIMIENMSEKLKQCLVLMGPPALCIIARSEQDGFTPGNVTELLESSVMTMLKSVFGSTNKIEIESYEQFYDPTFLRRC